MTFLFLGDDRGTGGDGVTVAWTTAAASLDPNSSTVLTVTAAPAPTADLTLALSATLPSGATLTASDVTIPANSTQGTVTILGSAALIAGSGSVSIVAGAGFALGSPSIVTVTTSGASSGGQDAQVGSAWIGGIGVGRELQWPTFEPTGGVVGQNYSAGGERAQVDTVMAWGDRKLCAVGCFGPSDTLIQEDAVAKPLPAENGVYPIDPWAGVTLSLEGLPASVGAAGNRAVATLSNPIAERALLGVGAPTHSGADLFRLAGREIEFVTDLAEPLRSPAEALVFATTRVDLAVVVYEITLTNSGVSPGRSAKVQADEDTGIVNFDSLNLSLPAGLAFVMQDTYAGDGGPDPAGGQIVKPFSGTASHGVKPATNFSWMLAVYETATVTAADARKALEGASTGLVMSGPQRVKKIGALGHQVMDWTKSQPVRNRAEIDARAGVYTAWVEDALNGAGTSSPLVGNGRERVGMHCILGPARNGGAGGQFIHFTNTWFNACPQEIKGLRILAEAFSRRVSNACHVRGEMKPRFTDAETVTAVDPWFGGSKEWAVSACPNRHHGGLQGLPVHTDPAFSASGLHTSDMPSRPWSDRTGRTFPVGGAGQQECLQLDQTNYDDPTHNWTNATSHTIRDMHVRDCWIVSKSGLAWWRLMCVGAYAENSVGAREGAFESLGLPGAFFSHLRSKSGANKNSARYIAGMNPVDATKQLAAEPGYNVVFDRTYNGLEGGGIDKDRENLNRFYGGAALAVLEAIACSPMAADIQDSMVQAVEGPRPEEDYDVPRAIARTLAWTTTEFGATASSRGVGDASDPFEEYTSNRDAAGALGYQRLRNQAAREGALPGGRVTGDGTAQGIPDGIKRLNYAVDGGASDSIFTQTWNNWQHSYHAQVAGALIEHFRAAGITDSDPLIAGIMPVARNTYYALKAQESHPLATAEWAPEARYQPCTVESSVLGARAMTLVEQQSVDGSWDYTDAGGDTHYFFGSLGSASQIFDAAVTEASMLATAKKSWVDPGGATYGTASDTAWHAALSAKMWDDAILTYATQSRNECQVLARLTESLFGAV